MNWPLIILVGIGAIILITFLVRRNLKDEKELESQLKNDYTKPKDDKSDIEIEDITK